MRKFFKSIINGNTLRGKIIRSLLFGVIITKSIFPLFFHPIGYLIGWIIFVLVFIAQLVIPTIKDAYDKNVNLKQMFTFKLRAWQRLMGLRGANYNHVFTHPTSGAKVFIGALPNKNTKDLTILVGKENIEAVISINEPWEREKIGVSHPYTDMEYDAVNIRYHKFDARDHRLVAEETLSQIADTIERELVARRNVYVHCNAGVGRSAMGVAASLIKHHNMTSTKAAHQIKYGLGEIPGRSQSSIMKKLESKSDTEQGLNVYALLHQNEGFTSVADQH